MALTSSISLQLNAVQSSALDLGTVTYPLTYKQLFDWANGTGADQAQAIFTDTRTLAASTAEDMDLNAALTDALGASFVLTKLKCLIIKAAAGNTNDVVIGGAPTNTFTLAGLFADATDKINVKPGGMFMWVAPNASGIAVAAGSADTIKIANSSSGSSVTYDIIAIGV